jgi:hypothetical protein
MELNRYKEDQKDKRQDVAATQRSKMISQTQQNGNPIDFEAEFDFNQLFKQ